MEIWVDLNVGEVMLEGLVLKDDLNAILLMKLAKKYNFWLSSEKSIDMYFKPWVFGFYIPNALQDLHMVNSNHGGSWNSFSSLQKLSPSLLYRGIFAHSPVPEHGRVSNETGQHKTQKDHVVHGKSMVFTSV